MSNQARMSDIAAYLTRVKNLLSAGKYDFVPRRKNMQENGEDILKCLGFHEDDFA